MAIDLLGLAVTLGPAVWKLIRAPEFDRAVASAVDSCETRFKPIEVRDALDLWLDDSIKAALQNALIAGDKPEISEAVVADFVERGGLYDTSPEATNQLARLILEHFLERLTFSVMATRTGLGVHHTMVTKQLDIVIQHLTGSASLDTSSSPEPASVASSDRRLYEERVDGARDLLRDGHLNKAREKLLAVRSSLPDRLDGAADVRFRIALNLGVCYLEGGQLEMAEAEFNAGLHERPGDVKALTNLAVLEVARGNAARALELASKAVEANSADPTANAALVRALTLNQRWTDIEKLSAGLVELEKEPHLLLAFGQASLQRDDFDRAREFFKQLASLTPSDGAAHLCLGLSICEPVLRRLRKETPLPWRMTPEDLRALREARDAFDVAVTAFRQHDNPERLFAALSNRGAVRALVDGPQAALVDCDAALALGIERDQTLSNRARMLMRLGRYAEAASALEDVSAEAESRSTAAMRAAAYRLAGASQRALDTLKNADVSGSSPESLNNLEQLLAAYRAVGMREEAEAVITRASEGAGDNPDVLAIIAEYRHAEGNQAEAVKLLESTLSSGPPEGRARRAWLLGRFLQEANEHSRAATIYDEFIGPEADEEAKSRYVVTLFNAGRPLDALARAQEYRGTGAPLPVITDVESVVLENMGDFAAARRCLRDLEAAFSLTPFQLMRLGGLEVALGDVEAAKRVFGRIDLHSLPDDPELLLRTAGLAEAISDDRSLALRFRACRVSWNSAEAQLAFAYELLKRPADDRIFQEPETVEGEVAVTVAADGDEMQFFILADSIPASSREVAPSSPIALAVLGRRVGEPVTAEVFDRSARMTVRRIENKFAALGRIVFKEFESRFPGHPAIRSVKVTEALPAKIREILRRRQEAIGMAIHAHASKGLPLALVAHALGGSTLDVWGACVGSPAGTLNVGPQSPARLAQELATVSGTSLVVPDQSALFTLAGLGQAALLQQLGLEARTTRWMQEELQEDLARHDLAGETPTSIAIERDRLLWIEGTAEESQGKRKFAAGLREMLGRMRSIPVPSMLSRDTLETPLARGLGKAAFSTLVAAKAIGAVLLVDDAGLRSVAETEFTLHCVSSQALLEHARMRGAISEREYGVLVTRMYASQYRGVRLTAEILYGAWKAGGSKVTPLLANALCVLDAPRDLRAAARGAAALVRLVVFSGAETARIGELTDALLTHLKSGRLGANARNGFEEAVDAAFADAPYHLAIARRAIAWRRKGFK